MQHAILPWCADSNGQDFGHGSLTLPAQGEIARFLDEEPFRLGPSEGTTFSFEASGPVAVLSLRGRNNERGEFLSPPHLLYQETCPVLFASFRTSRTAAAIALS
jgi:hypothetical protein